MLLSRDASLLHPELLSHAPRAVPYTPRASEASARLLVAEVSQLIQSQLSLHDKLCFFGCCRGLWMCNGIELALDRSQSLPRILEFQRRFGHRFVLTSLHLLSPMSMTAEANNLLSLMPGLRSLVLHCGQTVDIVDGAPVGRFELAVPQGQPSALRSLSLYFGHDAVCKLAAVRRCTALESLLLKNAIVEDLADLSSVKLNSLILRRCGTPAGSTGLHSALIALANPGSAIAWSLETLELNDCDVEDSLLVSLTALKRLHSLDLARNHQLTTTTPLGECSELARLTLTGCRALRCVASISRCPRLEVLHLAGCTSLTDVGPLEACPALRTLHLNHCQGLKDASPLGRCPTLTNLFLRNSGVEIAPVRSGLHVTFDTAQAGANTVGVM